MVPDSKMPLLVNVARLYYESGFSQGEIVQQLRISRPYVSKLLAMAKEENVVMIQIQDPTKAESHLERDIRSHFQLRRVIVTPSKVGENNLFSLGETAAKYLDSMVKSGDIIMAGWGRTMYTIAQRAIPRNDLDNLIVVSMGGIPTNFIQNIYAIETVTKFAETWGGVPYVLPVPLMIRSNEARDGIMAEEQIREVTEYMERANVALFTLGDMSRSSFWTQRGFMTDEEWQNIMESGAVGDVCLHILDSEGRVCSPAIDQMTVSIPLPMLKQKDYRVGIAAGREKIDIVYAALKAGIVNVLIVDEDIAKAVAEKIRKERMDFYR